jgi:hypothetical protein
MSDGIYDHIVYEKDTGRIIGSGTSGHPESLETPTLGVLVGVQANPGFSYLSNGRVVNIGDAPSPHHTFDWQDKTWVDSRTFETEWELVRSKRNKLLTACDWTQLPDAPASPLWLAYRQALRDITSQVSPFEVVWPSPPG